MEGNSRTGWTYSETQAGKTLIENRARAVRPDGGGPAFAKAKLPDMGRTVFSVSVVIAAALAVNGCNRHAQVPAAPAANSTAKQAKPVTSVSPAANAEDLRIASQAMNVGDVLLMLKRGDSQEAIIEQVRKRHLTQKIVEAQELELSLMGARRQLLAELKNGNNVLTETQELAYGKLHHWK
jgi:hypothetical protein